MKKDLPWFTHYNNARNHPKMKALRAQYGIAGYGLFWMLNEMISEAEEAKLDLSKKINRAAVAAELSMSLEQFDSFLAFLSDPEYDLVNYNDGILTTDRTQEDYSSLTAKREKNRRDYQGRTNSAAEKDNSAAESADSASGIDTHYITAHNTTNTPSKQAVKSTPPASESVDDSACLPAEVNEIKTKIKAAPWPSSFTNRDLVAFALRLKTTGAGLGFLEYCIERASSGKTEKPAGLFKAGLMSYQDWLEEYQATPAKPGTDPGSYEQFVPDLVSCKCGERPKVSRRLGEAVCPVCGRTYTYDRDWATWTEDEALKFTG